MGKDAEKIMKKYLLIIVMMMLLGFTACADKTEVLQEITPTVSPTSTPTSTPTPTPIPTPTVSPTPTPTATPTPTPIPSVNLMMVGDILMHTRLHECSVQEDGSYNYDAIFANTLNESLAADIAIVNQEVIIGGQEIVVSGYPSFNAPYEIGDALVAAGYDVVLHATNHALDKGKKGLLNCISFWNTQYPEVEVVGIYESAEDQDELCIIEHDGIRIAILNYTYGTNGIKMPADMPFAVDMLVEEEVIKDLELANSLADFVIVAPHWGTEYRLEADYSQKKWTKLFLEYGVDLVLGTHPHVIEPIEWLTNETTGESMLVYYSIGNFVNWTSSSGAGIANRMVGGIADVTIELDENGKAFIAKYGIQPVICHVEKKTNGVTVYPLKEYTKELAERNEIRLQDQSFSLEYCIELCDKVWGELWR